MSQLQINNHTALAYETLFANDEAFKPIVTPIIKATYDLVYQGPSTPWQLVFAKKQLPVSLGGEFWAEPESSSYRYEPECAFIKPTTDVVIIGDAVSINGPVTQMLVTIQVGQLNKRLAVFGDRQWVKQSTGYVKSAAQPFTHMPLMYENAFGGWDTRHNDTAQHGFVAENTVGKGFYIKKIQQQDMSQEIARTPQVLPNIENPEALIQSITDRPAPVGCGFTLPHWQPRAKLAGDYDQHWQENRSPLLPENFDRRYFNAASEGLIAPQYLQGNEVVSITNMTEQGTLDFNLPNIKAPYCQIETDQGTQQLQTELDTIIINTKTLQLQLIWRNYLPLRKSAREVSSIDIVYG